MSSLRKQYPELFLLLFIAALCLATVPAASAFTATLVSPANPGNPMSNGDVVSIQINGLAAGDVFTYRITSSNLDTVGNTATLSNVNMPFSFADGTSSTTLTTTGIVGSATLTVTRLSDSSQVILTASPITSASNIKQDTYDVSITGTKAGGSIGIDYQVSGTVAAPVNNPSTLSFSVTNVNSGDFKVEVLDGGTPRLSQTLTVGFPPTPTPTPGSSEGGGGGGAGPAPGPGPAPAPAPLLAPPGVSPTTTTIEVQDGKVAADYSLATDPAAGFSATLDISKGTTAVTATGQTVTEVSVTPLDPEAVDQAALVEAAAAQGGVYSFSGMSVECEPSGAQFTGGSVTISFSLTPEQWAAALDKVNGNTAGMTIGFYDATTKSWIDVPTTVDPVTHTVSAQVTHFSIFALYYIAPQETPTPQTYGQMMQATPAGTAAPGAAPAKTMLAPPSTTETPALPGIVVIGVVVFVGYCVVKKKR